MVEDKESFWFSIFWSIVFRINGKYIGKYDESEVLNFF